MKTILTIGIGAGDPEYLTVQAVKALNRVDVFFLMDKGVGKAQLNQVRRDICDRYIRDRDYRVVEAPSPHWLRNDADYPQAVEALNREKQLIFEQLIADELIDGQCGAFLVWGDPALYDSTVRILQAITQSGRHLLDYEVIPGISSVQALAARHRIALNTIGGALEITTGRRLAAGLNDEAESVVVMLDGENAYKRLVNEDIDIYWGANLATPDEVLIAGKLHDVAVEIEQAREDARQANGWVMDTYLLRRSGSE